MNLTQLAQEVKLDLIGVAPAGPAPDFVHYRTWVEKGYAAQMTYLTRPDAVLKRQNPSFILPEAKSVIVAAVKYGQGSSGNPQRFEGKVSRYAWGLDYHLWLLARLRSFVSKISESVNKSVIARCYVDTGPILERSWAQKAGLGWVGKNSCLIHPRLGSFLFLGVILINIEFDYPEVGNLPNCGTCTRCLDACPTGALVTPRVLDANRCIAYLTIENRGAIPENFYQAIDNHIFGCDICQDVCPWNKRLNDSESTDNAYVKTLNLREVLEMNADEFRQHFRQSPIWRATPEGLARNAAVVLSNQVDPLVKKYAQHLLEVHPSALVKAHLKWAL